MTEFKVGLVLSGGGAKGAYQVGVLKALIERGVQVDAIAGTSIGALNGAILAAAPSLPEGVDRMENLWRTLAENPPLAMSIPPYLILLLAGGLRLNVLSNIIQILMVTKPTLNRLTDVSPDPIRPYLEKMTDWLNSGLFSDHPIKKLMDGYFDLAGLSKGLPLYVSVFRNQDTFEEVIRYIIAEIGLMDARNSEFLHVQSLPIEQQKNALLASAAIPLLFSPKEVNGVLYTDGGQNELQGNTPITPLIENGCKKIIVTHLSEGSPWSRYDFPQATILEIRPRKSMPFVLDFKSVIPLIEQGYTDTLYYIDRVKSVWESIIPLAKSQVLLDRQEPRIQDSQDGMQSAISRLKKPDSV
jgi:NTE family protein